MRADNYQIADDDPAEAFFLDINEIQKSDIVIALLSDKVSAGVQVEIGYAIALKKEVILAHDKKDSLAWFNQAIIESQQARELLLPIRPDSF